MLISYFALLAILATGSLAVDTRVLNGEPATPHQFPYHVGLYWKSTIPVPVLKVYHYCGGAVVSDRWVLTAAHCVRKFGQIVVKAGKHVVDKEEANEQVRVVVRHITHPEYKRPLVSKLLIAQNDLALLEVDSPFIFNGYVNAAEIPRTGAYFESGSLAGWGSVGVGYIPNFPKELHYNEYLPVVDPQACSDAINAIVFDTGFLSVEINSNQTCSGPIGENFGACVLDGGSAFVNRVNDKYVIFGIVSWSNLLCGITSGVPTVYTRVAAYSNWINAVIGSY